LSAAYFLGGRCLVLEQEAETGGLARSVRSDGFVFDLGGHALHSKSDGWYALLRRLDCGLYVQQRKAFVDRPGGAIPFPFQYHLFRLPEPVFHECMDGLLDSNPSDTDSRNEPADYLQWLLATFGPGICRHFMIPYNRKIWKIELDRLTTEFASQRVPSLERKRLVEINRRGLPQDPQAVAYPVSGGIQAIPDAFRERIDSVRCNAKVTAINLAARTVTVNSDERIPYRHLVSTIPLPRFLEITEDLDAELQPLAGRFDWLSMGIVNFGVRSDRFTDRQRLYVSNPDILFHKVVFNSNSAPGCAPPGHGSVSVEITARKGQVLDPEPTVRRVRAELTRIGALEPADPVVLEQFIPVPYGYILYDSGRTPSVERCRGILRARNVHLCGRFGEWAYLNMDAVVESAGRVAEEIREAAG
jgi:UDP-galactopyranose mutase